MFLHKITKTATSHYFKKPMIEFEDLKKAVFDDLGA